MKDKTPTGWHKYKDPIAPDWDKIVMRCKSHGPITKMECFEIYSSKNRSGKPTYQCKYCHRLRKNNTKHQEDYMVNMAKQCDSDMVIE